MDKRRVPEPERCPAMPLGRSVAIGPLLHAEGRDRKEPRDNASSGRAIHQDAVLRYPENAPVAAWSRLRAQSEAREAASAPNGFGGDLCQAADFNAGAGPSDLSISFARIADRAAGPGMEHGYHVYPATARLCLSDSNHGLVQPLRPVLGSVGYAGREILSGRTGMGIESGQAGNLQFGSRLTIYERAVYSDASRARCANQHGWARPCDGQHLRGTSMAHGKVRRSIPEGLRRSPGCRRESSELFCILQSRTYPPVLGVSDSGSGLLRKKESVPNIRKNGHGYDRVAMRSWIVGQRSERIFPGKPVKQKNMDSAYGSWSSWGNPRLLRISPRTPAPISHTVDFSIISIQRKAGQDPP